MNLTLPSSLWYKQHYIVALDDSELSVYLTAKGGHLRYWV